VSDDTTYELPECPPGTDTVTIRGRVLLVRGLTRFDVMRGRQYQGDDALLDAWMIACGLDIPMAVAVEWSKRSSAVEADKLVSKVIELTGADEGNESPEG
jgi:hypothetical protein